MHDLATIKKMNTLAATKRTKIATKKLNRPEKFNREDTTTIPFVTPPRSLAPYPASIIARGAMPKGYRALDDGTLLCQWDIFRNTHGEWQHVSGIALYAHRGIYARKIKRN